MNTPAAIHASVFIVRAFVKLRAFLSDHKELAKKLSDLEIKNEKQFRIVFQALREIMQKEKEIKERPRIGYKIPGDQK